MEIAMDIILESLLKVKRKRKKEKEAAQREGRYTEDDDDTTDTEEEHALCGDPNCNRKRQYHFGFDWDKCCKGCASGREHDSWCDRDEAARQKRIEIDNQIGEAEDLVLRRRTHTQRK